MNFSIYNYKNISELNYSIQNGKINFLFGVSGAGKSSIATAVKDNNYTENAQFGATGETKVLVDGAPVKENDFLVFDEDTTASYFSGMKDENIYPILIDDDSELKNAQNGFYNLLLEVRQSIEIENEKYNAIATLLKNLGASKLNNDNSLKKTSQLYKVITSMEKTSNSRVYKEINAIGDVKFKWILDGVSFINDNNCPFCNKKINKKMNNKLAQYKEFDAKSISSLVKEGANYQTITGKEPSYFLAELKKMQSDIINMSRACTNYEEIQSEIEKISALDGIANNIKEIPIFEKLYQYFPQVNKSIRRFNNQIETLKRMYQKAKDKTAKILSKKTAKINKWISDLDIPYHITAKYNNKRVTDYKLVHNDDKKQNDSRKRLSNGERNIVSLILFILTALKNENATLIIDDPVSSYDEYRRKQICDLLVNTFKDRTILVLSHDNVFAKYAALEHSKKNNIGNVHYLENYNKNINFRIITKEDFGNVKEFIIERARISECYYQKIMNARMLYEGKNNTIEYQYLSAILHATDKDMILELLSNNNKNENEVVEKINEVYKLKLTVIPANYYKNIDVENFSYFEKALFYREYMANHPVEKTIKSEIDNYIHLNSRLYISLNPYSYIFSSAKLYKIIDQNVHGILNIKE